MPDTPDTGKWRSGRAGACTVENRRLAELVKKIHSENPERKAYFMRKTTIMTTRFHAGEGFYVDVIPDGQEVSFWLGHRDCDVRERMFAASLELAPQERWEKLIEDNLEDCLEDFREAWLEE